MEFQFQDNYDTLETPCPPKNYSAENIDAVYRWTFETIEDRRNFETQYHKNPKRFQNKTDEEKCMALALSMFNDLDGAKERFGEIADDIGEKIYRTIGNKIAKGKISVDCGLNSGIERLGHFNHHPAKGIPSKASFQILFNEIL